MGSIYTCAAQIKIDGSERAKGIAAEALDRVTDLARQLDSGESSSEASAARAVDALAGCSGQPR
jgi:hypothetical protein